MNELLWERKNCDTNENVHQRAFSTIKIVVSVRTRRIVSKSIMIANVSKLTDVTSVLHKFEKI